MERLPRNLLLVSAVSLLTDLSTEMGFPLLVLLLAGTGGTPLTLGLMEGLAESVSSFLKFASGRRSDRIQRRKGLTLLGYGLSGLLKLGYPFAANAAQLVTLRTGDRFGKGIRGAPRDALIADSVPPARWGFAYGFHRAMDTVGALLGPLLGLLLILQFSYREREILLLAAVPALAGVLLLLFVREPPPAVAPRAKAVPLPRDPALASYLLTVALFTMGNFGLVFLLLRGAQSGLSAHAILGIYILYNLTYAALALPMGALTDRIGRAPLVSLAFASMAAASAVVFLVRPAALAEFLLPASLFGLSSAAFEGNGRALAADFAPDTARGTVLGAYHATIGLAALPAGLLAGSLWQIEFYYAYAVGGLAGLGALAALLWLWVHGRLRPRSLR